MLAIIGALLLGQPLAGLIVVLMQTGGEALESYAQGRASEAVRELEAAAPHIAHRLVSGEVEDVPAETISVGDDLLLRPGELLACDSVVISGRSHVDVSRITGEPVAVRGQAGVHLLSGSLNVESALKVRATAHAAESQYARIVELVRTAQESKSPLQRLADRYAVWFTPLTLGVCAAAYYFSGDPIRVLAVLVVATPCPLILATPVAVVGGINRAARRGIIFRHGTALEQLGGVTIAVFDKTGTLTIGKPKVARVLAEPPFADRDILRLAGSIEQGSSHLLARTLIEEAQDRGIALPDAQQIIEAPGQGVRGEIEGHSVTIGGWSFVVNNHPAAEPDLLGLLANAPGIGLRAYVAIDSRGAGIIEYADRVRHEMAGFISQLKRLGITRTVLLSGDDQVNVEAVAQVTQIEEAHGDMLPEAKVAYVARLVRGGERVLMVGDGTNDAPALSTATVGVALAQGGGGITAEAADAVILADNPTRIVETIQISRRTVRVAARASWSAWDSVVPPWSSQALAISRL